MTTLKVYSLSNSMVTVVNTTVLHIQSGFDGCSRVELRGLQQQLLLVTTFLPGSHGSVKGDSEMCAYYPQAWL